MEVVVNFLLHLLMISVLFQIFLMASNFSLYITKTLFINFSMIPQFILMVFDRTLWCRLIHVVNPT